MKDEKLIWIVGNHSINSIIKSNRRTIHEVITIKEEYNTINSILKKNSIATKITIVEKNNLQRITKIDNQHYKFALKCSVIPGKEYNDLIELEQSNNSEKSVIVIMDQLNDVNNIGAIIRSCAAFNVKNIIVPSHGFPEETSAMIKSSAGNYDLVNIYEVNNLSDTIKLLKSQDYWVAGLASGSGSAIGEIKNFSKLVLVIGSEGKGIRPLVKKNCDILVEIPTNPEVESLNASNAAAIALYESSK